MANLRTDNLCGRGFVSLNDGTVWSNFISGSTLSGYPATNGFNGNPNNDVYPAAGGTIVWTAPNGGISGSKIEVRVYAGNTHPIVRVNGKSTGAIVGSSTPDQRGVWVDVTEITGGILKTITCIGETISSVARQSGFGAVRIDGEILVDGLVGSKGGRSGIDGSVYFDGRDDVTVLQVIAEDGNSDFTFGTGDFTIEFWVLQSVRNSIASLYGGRRDATDEVVPVIYLNSGVATYYTAGSNRITGSSTLALNSWHHIAIARQSGSTKLYVNGIQEGSTYSDSNSYVAKLNRPTIGAEGQIFGNNPLAGYLSNVRVCKGHAVYTTNYFTPPTSPLTVHHIADDDKTVLLCCQDSDNTLQEATGKELLGQGGVYNGKRFSNLATNGDLETGTTTNWVNSGLATFEVSTDNPHSGSYSLHCVSDGNGDACAYVIPVTLDTQKRYRISAYINVVGPGGTSARAKMKIGSGAGGNENYESRTAGQGYSGLGNWTYVEWIGLATSDTTHVTFNESSSNNVNDWYVDDLKIELWYPEEGVNILANPNFYSTATGWSFSSTPSGEFTIGSNKLSVADNSRTNDAIASQTLFASSIAEGRYKITINYSISSGDFDLGVGNNRLFGVANTYNGGAGSADSFIGFINAGGSNSSFRLVANQHCVGEFFDLQLSRVAEPKAPKILPPFGIDAGNTFNGSLNFNSSSWMYLPTGTTLERGGTRGLMAGGFSPSSGDTINFVTIQSDGSALDFGNLSVSGGYGAGMGNRTRGVIALGFQGSPEASINVIDFVTIMSEGNAQDFGDTIVTTYGRASASNSIRGIIAGGEAADNSIEFITIPTLGNGTDFGDLTDGRREPQATADPTRAVIAGGYDSPSTGSKVNTIDYIQIGTLGNASDFGDLTSSYWKPAAFADHTRGVFAGGATPSYLNIISFVTIQTTGDATDFGDLTITSGRGSGASDSTRGVIFTGLSDTGTHTTNVDVVTIQSRGNATKFGNTTVDVHSSAGLSNGHGGLG